MSLKSKINKRIVFTDDERRTMVEFPVAAGKDLLEKDDFWVQGDYHLQSQAGRWDPVSESWVQDDATSTCLDAGDPNSPIALEPFPNGGIINVGAYGGTAEASKSFLGTESPAK